MSCWSSSQHALLVALVQVRPVPEAPVARSAPAGEGPEAPLEPARLILVLREPSGLLGLVVGTLSGRPTELSEVVHPQDLAEAWRGLLYRARLSRHHRITREELSVREHMSTILRSLKERRVLEFSELFDPARGVPVLVVTFLALLELARESLIDLTQQSPFDPIYVKLKSERATLTIA